MRAESSEEPVVGGSEVLAGSPVARHTVFFTSLATEGLHGCSATVLDAHHILTAKHCLIGSEGLTDLMVVFATRFSHEAPMRNVTTLASYPGESITDNDIAVVGFRGDLPPGYAPVRIMTRPLEVGMPLVLAGYGRTAADSDGSDRGVLRSTVANVTVVRNDFHHFETSSPGHTICSGDSGGPDYFDDGIELLQAGVHSVGDCVEGESSVPIADYLEWIRSTGAEPLT